MPKYSSLYASIRKSMSARSDPFQPLVQRRSSPYPALSLDAPVGPAARNRPEDVRGVETALGRAGYLGLKQRSERGIFDSRLDGAVRSFQQRNELKVDGLLKPKGPTGQAVNRVLRRAVAKRRPTPPLTALSGEPFAANGRLVRHLMTTAADGIVPDLMAGDFRANEAGRAKTADFLSQLFARDPERAKSLHAKARGMMEEDEKSLLDRLILQARKADADEEDEPTPDDPGQDDPDDPEPDDPEKPEPDDPEEPEEPPKKPEPDCQSIIDAIRLLIKELNEVRDELASKKEKFDENQARITELEKGKEKSEAALNALFAARRLAIQSKSHATLIRIINKITKTREKLEKIKRDLEPRKNENEALKPEIEELEERERQKVENQRILEARLEKCEEPSG